MRAQTKFHRVLLTSLLAAGFGGPALADATLPHMHAGFWQTTMVMHMNMAGQPPDTDNTPRITYNCQSDATIATGMKNMAGALPGCTFDFKGSGGVYTITTHCVNPAGQQGTIEGTGTMTTQGENTMHMTETSTADMANMRMTTDMTRDSKWMGECPAGVVPGDFGEMQNGVFQKQGNTLTPMKPMGQ